MGMNICLLNVRELSDESFAKLMESAPNNSVIVLEDIDHYGNVTDGGGKVSLAGFAERFGRYAEPVWYMQVLNSHFR